MLCLRVLLLVEAFSCVWTWPSSCGSPPWGVSTGVVWHSLTPNQIFLCYFGGEVVCCVKGENLEYCRAQLHPGLGRRVSLRWTELGDDQTAGPPAPGPGPSLLHQGCSLSPGPQGLGPAGYQGFLFITFIGTLSFLVSMRISRSKTEMENFI